MLKTKKLLLLFILFFAFAQSAFANTDFYTNFENEKNILFTQTQTVDNNETNQRN